MEFGASELSSVGSPVSSTYTETNTEINTFATIDTTITTTGTEAVGGPASAIDYRVLGQNCSTLSGYSFLASMPLKLDFASKCDFELSF